MVGIGVGGCGDGFRRVYHSNFDKPCTVLAGEWGFSTAFFLRSKGLNDAGVRTLHPTGRDSARWHRQSRADTARLPCALPPQKLGDAGVRTPHPTGCVPAIAQAGLQEGQACRGGTDRVEQLQPDCHVRLHCGRDSYSSTSHFSTRTPRAARINARCLLILGAVHCSTTLFVAYAVGSWFCALALLDYGVFRRIFST